MLFRVLTIGLIPRLDWPELKQKTKSHYKGADLISEAYCQAFFFIYVNKSTKCHQTLYPAFVRSYLFIILIYIDIYNL